MSGRRTLLSSGGPVRRLASTAALSGVLPPHRIGMQPCVNACGNWQRNNDASAFNGCIFYYGVRGLW